VATIADAVSIIDENRIIVKEGLKRLSQPGNVGMYHLLKVCSLLGRKISTEMVGFIIAPKINAPGRIAHPRLALDLFLTQDQVEADKMAHELANINKKRMDINRKIRDEAIEMIEKHYKNDCFLVLHNDSWNKGVIGIVASTIVELLHKPTVIISEGYGSVRTVPEYPLIETLKACSNLFERWGGHPMAAGLKIKKSKIDAFRKRINEIAGQVLSPNPVPYINFDTKLKIRDINMNLVEDLERLEPFGNGNPLPHFVMEDLAVARDRVTKDGQHLQLTIRKDRRMSSVVGFWMAPYSELFIDPAQRFDVLFSVDRNRKNYERIILRDLKEVSLDW
jgi:single-stranded-DNA-specific exonuclease